MWLSKGRSSNNLIANGGQVTLSGALEQAVSSGAELRDAPGFGPYGYTARLPEGTQVLLLPSGMGTVWLGAAIQGHGDLQPGEIEIQALSGARIKLCQDGTVWLNGAHITKGGQFVPGPGAQN